MGGAPPLARNRQISVGRTCARLLFSESTSFPEEWAVDWEDEPYRFKLYVNRPTIPLDPAIPLVFAEKMGEEERGLSLQNSSGAQQALHLLSHLLSYSAGLLQMRQEVRFATHPQTPPPRAAKGAPGMPVELRPSSLGHFRAVPSGGALYPWEIYLCAIGDPGLPDGVYHYDPAHHCLNVLRTGSARGDLRASITAPIPSRGLVVFISAVYWKNYFKYAQSSVRLHALDAGILAGRLLDLSPTFGFEAHLLFQLVDQPVTQLLGLNAEQEAIQVGLVLDRCRDSSQPLGASSAESATRELRVPAPVAYSVLERSRQPKPCTVAAELNQWSALDTLLSSDHELPDVSCRWDERVRPLSSYPLPPLRRDEVTLCGAQLLRSRRSGIDPYHAATADLKVLGRICAAATVSHPVDRSRKSGTVRHVVLGCVVNRVAGIPSGVYLYNADAHELSCLQRDDCEGSLQSCYHLLNVNLAAAAAVLFVFGDYEQCLVTYGNRGYRLPNVEAGIAAERAEIAAIAAGYATHMLLGWSAKRVGDLFSLGGTNLTLLLGIAIGLPHRSAACVTLPLWV